MERLHAGLAPESKLRSSVLAARNRDKSLDRSTIFAVSAGRLETPYSLPSLRAFRKIPLRKLFSEVEASIEKYVINEKIEKVKHLMIYDRLSPNYIAIQNGLKQCGTLNGPVLKVTGFTPSAFRQLKEN